MPSPNSDLPDPKEWLDEFTSSLNGIANLTGSAGRRTKSSIPGLLGSRKALDAITQEVNGQSGRFTSVAPPSPDRLPSGALPYHSVPSPHAGHYATLDEAANAAARDVPKNPNWEYGAYLPQRYVAETIDLGDGFGPQIISHVDGYDYGGLYTSEDTGRVTLGPAPPHLGAWFHNHPWDPGVNNDDNQRPSPGRSSDEGTINRLHRTDPLMDTYILGPDGVLRKFWRPGDRGTTVK